MPLKRVLKDFKKGRRFKLKPKNLKVTNEAKIQFEIPFQQLRNHHIKLCR